MTKTNWLDQLNLYKTAYFMTDHLKYSGDLDPFDKFVKWFSIYGYYGVLCND